MITRILNRDFQHPTDGWYQIEAKGYHPYRSGKGKDEIKLVQVIDDKAISTIVNRFNADADANKLRHGSEMLIDHEHFSGESDQESRAYGWATRLKAGADGFYATNRWTATGKPAVDGGDYRFFSTEYDPKDFEEVPVAQMPAEILNRFPANEGWKYLRPLRLDGLSLTNMNRNRGQRPITNRGAENFPGSRESADSTGKHQQKANSMKSVCALLGLSAEADEASVHAAVTKLVNRGDITVVDLKTLREEHETFKNRVTALEGEQVINLLDLHGVKEEKVRNRLTPVLTAMKNREERAAALVDFGFKLADPKNPAKKEQRLLNREQGKNPGETEEAPTNDQERANKIRNRCDELVSGGMKFDAAFQKASREIPAAAAE